MNQETMLWLNSIPQPAFIVEKGMIAYLNEEAARYRIKEGLPFSLLLDIGKEEYETFTSGMLKLTLNVDNHSLAATAVQFPNFQLITIEKEDKETEMLKVLALAALKLREPLSAIMSVTQAISEEDGVEKDRLAGLNRSLLSLQRLVGNMSDGLRYHKSNNCQMTDVDVNEYFRELIEKAATLMEAANYHVVYRGLDETLRHSISTERMERAVYNLLSNAAKAAPAGTTIYTALERRGQTLLFSVEDCGLGMPPNAEEGIFTRFLREPELESGKDGMGLGMFLVRSAARTHGGTVLLRQTENGGTQIAITMSLNQRPNTLRSPIMTVDYTGGQDHGLLELSDILPNSLF